MGASKHKQELLSLTFIIAICLYLPHLQDFIKRLKRRGRNDKLAKEFKNQDQELYSGKSRLKRKARHTSQMA